MEITEDASERRQDLVERTHEFLVNQMDVPEQDIFAQAKVDGVDIQIHQNAADEPDLVIDDDY